MRRKMSANYTQQRDGSMNMPVTDKSSTETISGAAVDMSKKAQDPSTQWHPTNQAKKKVGSVKSYLFDNHVVPTLEMHGWTCVQKDRRQKSDAGDATGSPAGKMHVDRLFIPPGVTPGRPFKLRQDYFDSRQQVLSNLQSRPDKYGEEMSSYVLRFVDTIDTILKRKKNGEFRILEAAEGNDTEKRAERILAATAEEALLETVDDSIQRISEDASVVEAKKRLPKYVGDSSIPIFTQEVIDSDILGKVLANNGLSSDMSLSGGAIFPEVRVEDVPDDPHSVDLYLTGRRELVDELKVAVIDVIKEAKRKNEEEPNTFRKQTPDVPSKNNKNEKEKYHDHNSADRTSDVEEPGKLSTMTKSNQSKANDGKKFVKVTKMLPRFVGNSTREIFTNAEVESRIVNKILFENNQQQHPVALNTQKEVPLLEAKVIDAPSEPHSILLMVRGRMDLVQLAKDKLSKWINVEIIRYNLNALMTDGSSLEIDLLFDIGPSSKRIMGDVVDIAKFLDSEEITKHHHEGLWIRSTAQPGSQMRTIIGDAAARGGAVVSVDGIKISSSAELRDAWEKAEQRAVSVEKGASGGRSEDLVEDLDDSCPKVVITICVGKNADLGGIDKSRVLHDNGNPQRRDGARYHGKLNVGTGKIPQRKAKIVASTPAPSRRGNSSMVSESSSTVTKTPTDKMIKMRQPYTHFMNKYHAVRDIEYSMMRINGHQVSKSMWEKHKLIYGKNCDEKCLCPSDLKSLTETVVSDFVQKKAKKSDEVKGQSRAGFVDHFAPKFYKKVKAEFPDASPAQVLEKLVAMWPKHKETLRFGMKCSKNCPCGEGWKVIFLDKCLRPKSAERSDLKQSSLSMRSTHNVRGSDSSGMLGKLKLARKVSSGRSSSAAHQQTDFFVTFDPLVPLGFYCITEQNQCKIVSVNPNAEKRDARIQQGTIIVASSLLKATATVSEKTNLNSHAELRRRYEAAKIRKDFTKIRLWFTNTHSKSASTSDPTMAATAGVKQIFDKNDWTKRGAWQGKTNVPGWPGGAPVYRMTEGTLQPALDDKESEQPHKIIIPKSACLEAKHEHVQSQKIPSKDTHASSSSLTCQSETSRGILSTSTGKAFSMNHRKSSSMKNLQSKPPGPSLLKRNGSNRSEKRKVHFSPHIRQTKIFEPDADTMGRILEDTGRQETPRPAPVAELAKIVVNKRTEQQVHSNYDLVQAILYKDYKSVIQLLTAGEYENLTISDSKNKKPLDYVNHQLSSLRSDRGNNVNVSTCKPLDNSIKDFTLKKKALKIFIQAAHLVRLAKHLKNWVSIEIVPHQIRQLQLTDKGKFHFSTDFLFCLVRIDDIKKTSIPFIPLAEFVDFNCPGYMVSYNKELEFTLQKEREIVVNVIKGNSTVQGANVKLGTWSESIDNLRRKAETFGENIVEGQLKKSDFLASGSFSVKVRKRPLGTEAISGKRAEIAKQLSEVINWISMFQEETSGDYQGGSLLDANISIPDIGKLSLLHAAVYAADLELVKRVLSLGADPNADSEVGSAKDLAFKLADKTKDSADENTHNAFVAIWRDICHGTFGKRTQEESSIDQSIYFQGPSKRYRSIPEQSYANDTKEVTSTNSSFDAENPSSVHELADKVQSYLHSSPYGHRANSGQCSDSHEKDLSSHHIQDARIASGQSHKIPSYTEAHWRESSSDGQHLGNFATMQKYSDTIEQKADLPQLPTPDWIEGRNTRCSFFNKACGCRFGTKCFKAHCFPPIGSDLDDDERVDHAIAQKNEYWNKSYVHFKEALDSHFRTWYTAAYFDREQNIIFYSERGNFSHQSQQGIYWYRSKDHALNALKRVWAIATARKAAIETTNEFDKKHSLQHPYSVQPEPKKTRTTHIDDSALEMLLPQMPSISWIEGKSKKCMWFDSPGGCPYGKECRNAHIMSPVESVANDFSIMSYIQQEERERIFDRKFVHVKELMDPSGKRWYTAAFYNPVENIIVYAERGRLSRQNGQGIYLYPNRELAIKALEIAVFTSLSTKKGLLSQPIHSSPQQSNSKGDCTRDRELFHLIIKANLSNAYIKIFPGQALPKKCWQVVPKNDLFTATLHSPAKDDKGARYSSVENGGVYINDRWWYKDEKFAKASAFMQFLRKAAERGLVSDDMTKTSKGSGLFK